MLLEVIFLHSGTLTETELGSSLVEERILWQSPSVFEVVVARPRIINLLQRLGVQD